MKINLLVLLESVSVKFDKCEFVYSDIVSLGFLLSKSMNI